MFLRVCNWGQYRIESAQPSLPGASGPTHYEQAINTAGPTGPVSNP